MLCFPTENWKEKKLNKTESDFARAKKGGRLGFANGRFLIGKLVLVFMTR